MLYRKIEQRIEDFLHQRQNRILLVDGARQVGKTYIIRKVGQRLYKNFIEINMLADANEKRIFETVRNTTSFYEQLSAVAGNKMGDYSNTLVFIDEIQAYPHLLTMLKFLKQENKFTFIASGSQLGLALAKTVSVPIGSIEVMHMYPLDFEEFLIANNVGSIAINAIKTAYIKHESLNEGLHEKILGYFKRYLICGGLPDAVNSYVETKNIQSIRTIQKQIHEFYAIDASQYDKENKLKVQNVFSYIPSALENKKKRIMAKHIENRSGRQMTDYAEEFDYLINSGVTLEVRAISNPKFPLIESEQKNLLKLYLNDVGILTALLFDNNIRALLDDESSINLGTAYESVVAQELHSHGFDLKYYDNKKNGEVDFLVDDYVNMSVLPIEVKSGKDYKKHSALTHFMATKDYNIKKSIVFSNNIKVEQSGNVLYMPIYFVMCLEKSSNELLIPDVE